MRSSSDIEKELKIVSVELSKLREKFRKLTLELDRAKTAEKQKRDKKNNLRIVK